MIRLHDRALPPELQQYLDGLQADLDRESDYARCVKLAADMWKNRTTNKQFERIREILYEMCFGPRRCAYCEDSLSAQIEHVKPKSLYPEATFSWENFLPTCGRCNSSKNAEFAVFVPHEPKPVQVARPQGHPVVPPRAGEPALIHPRREDPLRFLILDLKDTFHIHPRPGLEGREQTRAQWTIEKLLKLNSDALAESRRDAFHGYRAHLREYIQERDANPDAAELARCIKQIQRIKHRFVWEEMKTQREHYPSLRTLFDQAPEALGWPALPWEIRKRAP
ncbi:MAG TPA: HNH endonuclease [Haliangium sp.]|nr:HNH endonuclease [Haliangium sp.]